MSTSNATSAPFWEIHGLTKLFEKLPKTVQIIGRTQRLESHFIGQSPPLSPLDMYVKESSPQQLTVRTRDGERQAVLLYHSIGSNSKTGICWVHRQESWATWCLCSLGVAGSPLADFAEVSCKQRAPTVGALLRATYHGWHVPGLLCNKYSLHMFESGDEPHSLLSLLRLRRDAEEYVKVAGRDTFFEQLDQIEEAILLDKVNTDAETARLHTALNSCVSACNALVFSETSLQLADHAVVPVSEDALTSKSPVFKAMLAQRKDGLQMQEASSGTVRLEHASLLAVKSIVSLLHTDGRSLKELHLSAADMLDVVAQAAEWQCTSLLPPLLAALAKQVFTANACVAAKVLKTVNTHKSTEVTCQKFWKLCEKNAVARLANLGDFTTLQELPFQGVLQIMKSNDLDTDKSESKVLQLAVQWVKTSGQTDKMTDLIKEVRFPLIPAARLSKEHQADLSFIRECGAGDVLEQLQGEAIHVQLQRKRKSKITGHAFDADDDGAKRRVKARKNSGEVPQLSHAELAKLAMASSISG